MKKIAIIGSRSFSKSEESLRMLEEKMSKVLERLSERYENVCVVSGGQPKGADGMAKKLALQNNFVYKEFPPAHYRHNQYCVKSKEHYSQKYHVSNFFARNSEIIEYSDIVIAFIPATITIQQSKGTYDSIKKAKKLNKRFKIIKV